MKKPGVLAPPPVIPSASKPSQATIAAAAAAAAMQQTGPPKVPQPLPAQAPSQDQVPSQQRVFQPALPQQSQFMPQQQQPQHPFASTMQSSSPPMRNNDLPNVGGMAPMMQPQN